MKKNNEIEENVEKNEIEQMENFIETVESEVPAETENSTLLEETDGKKKGLKKIAAKKLPGILKKNYKANKIEKKLYKRILITSDKELVMSMFEENPNKPGYLFIPRDKMIEKIDFKRLKSIGKDVKKQKTSFKFVPFIAVVATIIAVCIAVITFKNPLAKKGITYAMQKVFGARTDIAWVDVQFMRATITIGNLQQANRYSPMKNLFQIDKTEISFNLTEALRGKFDARNIEVTGLAIDTDRTYSGELPGGNDADTPIFEKFAEEVTIKADAALEAARLSIENAFAEYNPVNMIANVQDNLKSPQVAKDVQAQVEASIEKWQAKPEEMQKKVEDFYTRVETFADDVDTVINKDFANVSDAADVKNAVAKANNLLTQVNSLLDESKTMSNDMVKSVVDEVKADSKNIKAISNQVQDALKSDTALVKSQLDKITSFNLDTGTKILGNALEAAMYAVIGRYYPYVVRATNYAMQLKAKSSKTTKEEQKKAALLQPRHERFPGIDIYWKNDNVPKFLIEKIQFSGLGVTAKGTQISSDMDKRGAPATLIGSYTEGDVRTHNAQIVVDARTNTANPLVGVEYSGNNFPVEFETPYLNLDSNSMLTATGAMDKQGAIKIGTQFNMGKLALTADEFEPAIAHRFYSTALQEVNSLVLGVQIGIDTERRLSLKLSSDLDERFNSILKGVVNKELKVLISEAEIQLNDLLNEQCGDVMIKISDFVDIENGINAQSLRVDNIGKTLESNKKILEKKIKEQASSSIKDALDDAGIDVPDVLVVPNLTVPGINGGAKKDEKDEKGQAEKAVGNVLKGLFGN